MKGSCMNNVINLVVFNIIWALSAWGGANNHPEVGVISVSCSAAIYIWRSQNRKRCIKFYSCAAALGFFADTLLIQIQAILVPSSNAPISPLFMVCLWINFATTFDYSLHWVHKYFKSGLLCAFLGAPGAYYAGAKAGAIQLNPSLPYSLGSIGILWTGAMAVLVIASRRWRSN